MQVEEFEALTHEELLAYVKTLAEGGIRITFSGKDAARRISRKVQPRSIRRFPSLSVGSEEEQARNLVIEGENLQAVVTLYKERGQVDLIITDPPFNTGKDFRYNDKWEDDPNDPGLGDFVDEDDLARHTKWMRFMYPRLRYMKTMLKPQGVLAICIDHRELFHLGQMLDEIFGERNRIGIINWQKSYSPRNDNKHISTATEYVLVYAKDLDIAKTGLLERTEEMDARYSNLDDDPEGEWGSDNPCAGEGPTHPGMVYGIQSPFTGEIQYPPDGKCWRSERPRMKAWLEQWGSPYEQRDLKDGKPTKALVLKGATIKLPTEQGQLPVGNVADSVVQKARKKALAIQKKGPWPQLYFLKEGEGRARLKRYKKHVKKGIVAMTYWADDDYDTPFFVGSTSWDHEESGHSQAGITELDAIVGPGHGFTTVKPLKLFSKIVRLWCPPDGLVMDMFAGSGTAGHAVLALNQASGSNRRFILIEQGRPDKGDSYARTLTVDRLRRAISGEWASGKMEPLGGGFRFCALQNKVDAKAVLGMERDEMTDAVIASHFDASRRGGPGLILMTHEGYQYLVARNADDEGFYLVWSGAQESPVFDASVYEAVAAEAEKAGLKPVYHVYARFNLYQSEDVVFYQIPDRILMDFGLNAASEPFHNEDE